MYGGLGPRRRRTFRFVFGGLSRSRTGTRGTRTGRRLRIRRALTRTCCRPGPQVPLPLPLQLQSPSECGEARATEPQKLGSLSSRRWHSTACTSPSDTKQHRASSHWQRRWRLHLMHTRLIQQAVHLEDLVILSGHRHEFECEVEDRVAGNPRLAGAVNNAKQAVREEERAETKVSLRK